MLKHIYLITGVEIGDISTARLYELLFEIAYRYSMNLRKVSQINQNNEI